ncbi:FecR family protein [Chitinophaga cymbidii]|uniref:Anti-sigma factor n=1 Tax=Chitinophaga cymbidii TaxID=1096750 RepID=A0A512RGX9_9BACT|nr:FecR domain-containing protein [Chitinophaga cymbidii]GEP94957.1 anti-sigma factor [Chitinophaga cymbidii]
MSLYDVKDLLEKYKSGTCTPEELQALESWYESWRHPDAEEVVWKQDEELAQELLADFSDYRRRKEALFRTGSSRQTWWRAAAVVVPILGIGALLWLSRPGVSEQAKPVLAVSPDNSDGRRFILLPDSSTVVLQKGSSLIYPETFKGDKREVTLTGEAYFDIYQQQDKPFVIHSGKVITTVLGTAFNIKAYPDQPSVTVTVRRGKVKIEEERSRKLLGILLPDQQIVYNNNEVAETRAVKAAETVAWVKQGLDFISVPFEEIARQVSDRYQVKISFANPALKNCRIRATFEGTESLEKVLMILCTVRDATYTINGDEVMISGDGCADEH